MATASVTITGTPEAPIFNFDIPQGEKGDPGGLTNPVVLNAGEDLNNLTASGSYRMVSTNATVALNSPRDGVGGHIIVHRGATTVITQLFHPLSQSALRGIWQRSLVGSWGAWMFIPAQRIDQTAGRAVYTWDDLNNREQLVWGDTGERDIAANIQYGTAGAVKVRRIGSMVELRIVNWAPGVANSQLFTTGLELPSGFRNNNTIDVMGWDSVNSVVRRFTIPGNTGIVQCYTPATNSIISANIVFSTLNAWPTALPGAAVAGVPNT